MSLHFQEPVAARCSRRLPGLNPIERTFINAKALPLVRAGVPSMVL